MSDRPALAYVTFGALGPRSSGVTEWDIFPRQKWDIYIRHRHQIRTHFTFVVLPIPNLEDRRELERKDWLSALRLWGVPALP